MKATIEVPEGLLPRLVAVQRRALARIGDDDAAVRLFEISLLTAGVEALERRYPEKGPATLEEHIYPTTKRKAGHDG